MSQSIKDRIKTQIQINQQLLNYDDSDSQDYQDQEAIVVDLPKVYLNNVQQQKCNEIDEHEIMNEKRKRVLKDLQISSKQNMSLKYIQGQRVLRIKSKQNIINDENNKQIVDLKSKLAQVFKQSQIKQSKINIFQQSIIELNNKIYELSRLNEQNENKLVNKDNEIMRLVQDNKRLQQKYGLQLKQYEKQYKKRSNDLKQQVQQMNEILLKKQQHITKIQAQLQLKNRQIQLKSQQLQKSNKHIQEKNNLIQQKNKQILLIRKLQKKSIRCIQQNNKLKQDIKRLLLLLENNINTQNLLKSIKNNNSLLTNINKQHYFKSINIKSYKSHTKSIKSQFHSNINNNNQNKKNNKNNKNKHLSQLIQTHHYQSLPSKTQLKSLTSSQWLPISLINQVQMFLKKYHIAQNNHLFVNHLVSFINHYTDKCINQNKSIMENQFKSLKKQIQRKTNHSLNMVQIMKQKQLKIKLNQSQNYQKSLKSAHKQINKCQHQNKHDKINLQSEYISILVPASNNSLKDERKNNLLSSNSINNKISPKDQIRYLNLEKSIKLHRQSSNNNCDIKIQSENIQKVKSNISRKDNLDKKQRKRYKTQSSPKFTTKSTNKNNQKKHKTITQTKYDNLPFRKYKII